MKKLILIPFTLLAFSNTGCEKLGLPGIAKDRPVVQVPDANQERWTKSTFANKVWLSKVTVVKTSGNGGFLAVGYQSDAKAGYFKFTKNQLRYENANTLYLDDPTVDGELLNSWDIEHSDYRLSEVDGRPTNTEEENNYLPWDQKRFFKVNWEKANISEGASFPYSIDFAIRQECWMKVGTQLVKGSQEISDNYISFTLAVDYQHDTSCNTQLDIRRGVRGDVTFTAHYKYSFMKMPKSDYSPWAYDGEFDPLMMKYGYFQTILESKGDVFPQKNTIYMNRWNPNKTHTYYFEKYFPEKYKWIFNDPKKGIFAKTNALFKKHGLNNYNSNDNTCTSGLCFEIKENSGQELGDIRYSFVTFVDEADPAAPLGYGPSDANPFTGEIVSANLLIWTGYLDYYTKRLEQTLPREEKNTETDKFLTSTLFKQMARTLEMSPTSDSQTVPDVWTSTGLKLKDNIEAYKAYIGILPDFTYGYPGWARFTSSGLGNEIFPNQSSGRSLHIDSYDKSLMNLSSFEKAAQWIQSSQGENFDLLERTLKGAKANLYFQSGNHQHVRDTTLYPIDHHLADARELLLGGKNAEDVINTLLYRVSIHEFGHNLNLRHNFYGSVDENSFRAPIPTQIKDKDGNIKEVLKQQSTSSVMEYLDLKDEIFLEEEWEPYDEAALIYAYSHGKIDLAKINNKNYLYCTDEHKVLNILCNTWDRGSTPSEVALSLIESYESIYEISNKRFDRPYWDASSYDSRIFSAMWDIKKFVLLYETSLRSDFVKAKLSEKTKMSSNDINEVNNLIQKDLERVMKLSVAFYDAVLQQSQSEKHYRDQFDPSTGALQRIGIAPDKIYAMMFLMGDSGFMYNPNLQSQYATYLDFINDPSGKLIDKVMENLFTSRVDMEDWFAGFGRQLFAQNAFSFRVLDNPLILDKIKVACYTPDTFKAQFGNLSKDQEGVNGEKETLRYALRNIDSSVKDPDYKALGGKLGILFINGNYYVSHERNNRYSYKIIENMIQNDVRFDRSLELAKYDILESYQLYWRQKEGRVPECR
ncbi:MAG: zinc-dependent metalloprotease [Bdellovibrionales bacterium]|nr:zinc-dependent metalloprotease [Bdellovibrionales bacterium]